jgi:hypothetical protein
LRNAVVAVVPSADNSPYSGKHESQQQESARAVHFA